jgi:proline iminopeptidase
LEVFIEDLEAIRKSFPFEKVSILGHSWGGFLAMNYANIHSDKIDKLILLSSMPASSEDLGLFFQEYMKRTAPHSEELEVIRKSNEYLDGDPATVTKHLRLMFGTYCASPESVYQLNLTATQQENLNASAIHGIITQSVFLKPYNLDLSNITCKTLVIQGDKDAIPLATAENLHKKISGSNFVTLQDCGHFPYIEQPEALFDAIEQFLNGPFRGK